MKKARKNRRKRYMDLKEFIDFGKGLKVPISDMLLERLEQEGIFIPVYRVTWPRELIEARFSKQEEAAEHWKDIIAFEREMDQSQIPMGNINNTLLKEGHPLDKARGANKSFIQTPDKRTFKPWIQYEVKLKYPNGARRTERCSEHFYEAWQIYHLEEITGITLSRPRNMLLRGNLELPSLSIPVFPSGVVQFQEMHKILADYQFRCQLHFEKVFESSETAIIEGNDAKKYYEPVSVEGMQSFKRANEARWIEFIRELCKLYFQYESEDKESLKSVVRQDILDVCQLVIDGLALDYEALARKIGHVIGGTRFIRKLSLEYIFPDIERELIREGGYIISPFLQEYARLIGKSVDSLDPQLPEDLVRYAIQSRNEALIIRMIEINRGWFRRELYSQEGLWTSLRTLSIAVESLGKDLELGKNIASILNKAMGNQFEARVLTPLDKKWRESGHPGSVDEMESPEGLIERIDFIVANGQPGVGQYLLTTKLLRNYLSHNTATDAGLLGNRFYYMYRSLVLTALLLFHSRP